MDLQEKLISQFFLLKEAGLLKEGEFNPMRENLLRLSKDIEGFRKCLRAFVKQSCNRQIFNFRNFLCL
jgi:hypothetical protein